MTPPENPISFALRTLAELKPGDPRLVHLTREVNHLFEVIRVQGERTIITARDMQMLFMRMHDIASIEPVRANPAKPEELTEGAKVDLDQLETSMKRVPQVFKMPQTLKERT
jgi:hypothetical protein